MAFRKIIKQKIDMPPFIIIIFILFYAHPANAQPPPAGVVVSPLVIEHVQDNVTLIGIVEPWRASIVAAEVSGRVESLDVRRGDKVSKGQVLASLGKSDLMFSLEGARARRNATEARLEKARDVLERSAGLMKDQAISDREYKEYRLTVQELEEDLSATKSEILQIEDEVERKTVQAPFDGVVTRELTEIGQWVERGGGIVHLVDLSVVRVLVDLPEQYVAGVKGDENVAVRIDALGKELFKGKIHALIPEGNKESHIFPLEVHVGNKDSRIKGGMLARADFNLGLNRQVLMAHKDAIIARGDQKYLFTVDNGMARQIFVITGQAKGDLIEVNGDLRKGEDVIIRGNERVRDGQPVQIIPHSR